VSAKVLEILGFEESSVRKSVISLFGFAAVNYALTYMLLLVQNPKYESIKKEKVGRIEVHQYCVDRCGDGITGTA
jgi:hypothetical protein